MITTMLGFLAVVWANAPPPITNGTASAVVIRNSLNIERLLFLLNCWGQRQTLTQGRGQHSMFAEKDGLANSNVPFSNGPIQLSASAVTSLHVRWVRSG